MSEFKNKTVLITGSSSGIGKAIAEYFLDSGAIVHGISLSKVPKKPGYTHWQLDISNLKKLQKWVAGFLKENSIDILINNAGIYPQGKLLKITEKDWDKVFGTNVRPVFFLAQRVAQSMRENSGGVIMNAASYAGLHPSIGSGIYAAGKAAVISLTKSMAAEWAPYGIRVNAYSPGFILTGMTQDAYKQHGEKMIEDIALNRYGKPKEVAEVVGFLCSDKASYVTGENIEITGGKFLVQNQSKAHEKS